MIELSEEQQKNLKTIVDHFDDEDREVRERQVRLWRRLKLLWDGFQQVWFDSVAHDWRIWDEQQLDESSTDQSYYDKPINILKAYLESIIAALSITVPAVKCFPDDADNDLDLITAKAGDKIAELVYRHNNAPLLWIHALYIFCTEGLVACYSYPKEDAKYGTYDENKYDSITEEAKFCPTCNTRLSEELFTPPIIDQFAPYSNISEISCPMCKAVLPPDLQAQTLIVNRLVGITKKPKSRICLEAYGGLYVKVPNYAMKQEDIPYLLFSYETHYTNVLDRYPKLRERLVNSSGGLNSMGGTNEYERWARLNTQYRGEYPANTVSVRNCWLRPSTYNILPEEQHVTELKKKFPDGCKVVMVNDLFAEACDEALDDCWTLTKNPLSDYLQHDPLGNSLIPIQEITNDMISLVLQTIEHGIPQTFADPQVLDFKAYNQTSATPGSVYKATPRTGKTVGDAFHEVKTATLSQEILPFFQQIQTLGQLVSGALPSLFGGQLDGSNTASEYSMSRAQALQRLQNNWKMFTSWWKEIHGKVIPMFIEEMKDDERMVQRDEQGNFLNVFIRKAEVSGKIGSVELEANEQLPVTWSQQKDLVMKLLEMQNPEVLQTLASPENIRHLQQALGLNDFVVPGEDDRQKQNDEIKQLINSSPIPVPSSNIDPMTGMVVPEIIEMPSVEIEPEVDNHNVHAEVCRHYLVSEAGRQLKVENPEGYKNVLLHLKMHLDYLAQLMMPPTPEGNNQENKEKTKGSASPLMEKDNVSVQS